MATFDQVDAALEALFAYLTAEETFIPDYDVLAPLLEALSPGGEHQEYIQVSEDLRKAWSTLADKHSSPRDRIDASTDWRRAVAEIAT